MNKIMKFEFRYWEQTGYLALITELVMVLHAIFLMCDVHISVHPLSYSGIVLLNVFSIIPLLFVYLSIVRGYERSRTTFYFRLLIFWDIFYLYLNSYTWIVNGQVRIRANGYLISTAVFIDSIWMYYLFWKFMCAWLEQENIFTQKLEIVMKGVSVIGILLILGNIFGGYYYTISETGLYEKSNTYWTNMLIPSVLVCVMVYFILKQKISSWNKVFFLSYPLLPLLGALVTISEKGPTLLCIMTFLSILLMYSNLFVTKQWQNIQYQAEIAHQETEIANEKAKVVISQIKPHFLYNSLVAIMEIEGNPPETKQALKNFAKYLRGNIRSIDNGNVIPITHEIEHVKQYTSLEMLRFPDVKVEYELHATDFMIPPLTVQMLVENAILHGVSSQENGGHIRIETNQDEWDYMVRIVDDGIGFDEEQLDLDAVDERGKAHVGIKNVRLRLWMVNGYLNLHSTPGKGTIAEIRIPKDRKMETAI